MLEDDLRSLVFDVYDEPETCTYVTEPDQCGIPGHEITICIEHGGCYQPCEFEVLIKGVRALLAELDALRSR